MMGLSGVAAAVAGDVLVEDGEPTRLDLQEVAGTARESVGLSI
jgi:hypothetical protein